MLALLTALGFAEPCEAVADTILVVEGRVVPRAPAAWLDPPDVFVRPESRYSVEEIEAAAAWWRARGEPIGTVRCAPGTLCTVRGAIVVDAVTAGFESSTHLGETQRLVELDAIVAARIELVDVAGPLRPVLLLHELGHALGFRDAAFGRTPMRLPLAPENTSTEGLLTAPVRTPTRRSPDRARPGPAR